MLYPESDGYTADAFIEDDNGLVQILNREAVNFDNLTSMKRMTVDVNGYDSDKTVILFILKGIDFQCSFTPKLVSCDADGQIIQMDNNVITAEFDTPVPTETACYSINNGAKIVKIASICTNSSNIDCSNTIPCHRTKNPGQTGCLSGKIAENAFGLLCFFECCYDRHMG